MRIIIAVFCAAFVASCTTTPPLVNYDLPKRPPSCTEDPKELSKKDVKRDLEAVGAIEWHADDRLMYAKERAKWLDCKRFLNETWKRMQSKR